ncbi:MAG: glycosyltransferase [Bacteroidales bacterium]
MKKRILFLSALDFKEKSIQIIRKTPEAFVKNNWIVDYIVIRDNSKHGNYFYENTINIEGIRINRKLYSLAKIRNRISNSLLLAMFNKVAGYLASVRLAYLAIKLLKTEHFDVIYGYEIHGVLALGIIRLFGEGKKYKTIHRFQGTWISNYYKNRLYFKLILNWDSILAMCLRCDLCIMTDDGTQGDFILNKLHSPKNINFRFWINGVDEQKLSPIVTHNLRLKFQTLNKIVVLSICRLEAWKRVDRAINVISLVINKYKVNNIKYIIVGEGSERERLQQLTKDLNLENYIFFVGGIQNVEVKNYLNIADFFISTYDLSNVGNPLLEAIRANKIIFTLNNGDTSSWIQHRVNGFLYDISKNLIEFMAKDIYELINNPELKETIIKNIKITENEKLWTWEERMNAEVSEIEKLII